MTTVAAFDPGLTGGIAFRGDNITLTMPMPLIGNELDLLEICCIIRNIHRDWKIDMALVEKVSAMPKQGVVSMFRFGEGYGSLKGILAALQIPYTLVTPQAWTKEMHAGLSKDIPAKDRSRMVASRIFPDVDFLASPRSKVPHSGKIDALLLAEHGYRLMRGSK
jgi:crossover junction endodeoxyribonuclease RuvC